MRFQTTPAEVFVPEQPTLSITAAIAPEVAGGLHSLAEKHLAKAGQEDHRRTGDVITNTFTGTSSGTVIQIGKVHGQVNDNRGR
ncbi:hypothetical protein SK803_28235 [Lentzea sp. BCCO 10_0856]|uniref:Uncharacterized protein n=1 Tax=Lentzea miocenica TaxID=3095431 RepID=A0ABU4T7I9_9PSEU|nr:hypothetical protein [Lentzea sp. BCCO 10_0856]MDX8034125.1 hypothetical protein [Lentzea sp. BCCO 10_0856]